MATPVTSSSANAATEAVLGKPAGGFDARRPFRYAAAFIGGTFRDALNFSSALGHKGMWVGAGFGVLAFFAGAALPIAGGALVLPIMGAVAGLAAGAVGGLALGTITGGVRGVARSKRVEDNADLAARRDASKAARSQMAAQGADYRDAYREQQRRQNYATDRILQTGRENAQDNSTYWTDRVENHHGHGHGRGW